MMDRDRELHEMADEGRALMNDYIKRGDAYSSCCYETPECYMARKDIKALPSADVAPVRHGRWKTYKTEVAGRGFFYCTACHADVYDTSDYCPNCGAKMDKGE